jgi:hypothetical protein
VEIKAEAVVVAVEKLAGTAAETEAADRQQSTKKEQQ